jgi:hypothetical protein
VRQITVYRLLVFSGVSPLDVPLVILINKYHIIRHEDGLNSYGVVHEDMEFVLDILNIATKY